MINPVSGDIRNARAIVQRKLGLGASTLIPQYRSLYTARYNKYVCVNYKHSSVILHDRPPDRAASLECYTSNYSVVIFSPLYSSYRQIII